MKPLIFPTKSNKLVKSHTGPIYSIKFSKSGEYCMTGSEDRSVVLFNPRKNMQVKVYKNLHNYEVSTLDISSDNSRFITGGSDKVILLSDVYEGKVIHKFQGHSGRINAITYN